MSPLEVFRGKQLFGHMENKSNGKSFLLCFEPLRVALVVSEILRNPLATSFSVNQVRGVILWHSLGPMALLEPLLTRRLDLRYVERVDNAESTREKNHSSNATVKQNAELATS